MSIFHDYFLILDIKCKRVYRQRVKIESPFLRLKSPTNPHYTVGFVVLIDFRK